MITTYAEIKKSCVHILSQDTVESGEIDELFVDDKGALQFRSRDALLGSIASSAISTLVLNGYPVEDPSLSVQQAGLLSGIRSLDTNTPTLSDASLCVVTEGKWNNRILDIESGAKAVRAISPLGVHAAINDLSSQDAVYEMARKRVDAIDAQVRREVERLQRLYDMGVISYDLSDRSSRILDAMDQTYQALRAHGERIS